MRELIARWESRATRYERNAQSRPKLIQDRMLGEARAIRVCASELSKALQPQVEVDAQKDCNFEAEGGHRAASG